MIRTDPALRSLLAAQALRAAGTMGLTAVLVLFLTRDSGPSARDGIGLSIPDAASWFAVYLSLSFLTAVPCAWVVDRLTGGLRGYLLGLVLCLLSQLWLVVDRDRWLGAMMLLAVSAGLAKDTFVGLVSITPSAEGGQRHRALTLGQMSLATGSIIGPLVTGLVSGIWGWAAAFASCAVFSAASIAVMGLRWRVLAPLPMARTEGAHDWAAAVGAAALTIALVAVGGAAGAGVDAWAGVAAAISTAVTVGVAVFLLGRLRRHASDAEQRRRDTDFGVLFTLSTLFWVAASMTASVINLFVDTEVDRTLAGATIPTAWLQIVGPITILVAVPIITHRMRAEEPLWRRTPRVVALALTVVAIAFALLLPGAWSSDGRPTANIIWPVLALAGVSLSSVLLNPVGQSVAVGLGHGSSHTVALWFLATACGISIGGLLAQGVDAVGYPWFFAGIALLALGASIAARVLRRPLERAAGAPLEGCVSYIGNPGLGH